jgi:hypothetical protein
MTTLCQEESKKMFFLRVWLQASNDPKRKQENGSYYLKDKPECKPNNLKREAD